MKAPTPASDELILSAYCALLEEIKRRHDIIGRTLDGEYAMDLRTAEELCFFHLRMICELIAVSCLVVHGDIQEARTGKLKSAYQADMIIRALGKLHSDFYPRPGKQVIHPDGSIEVLNVESGFLTKEELIKLYHRCGDVLHIGALDELNMKWNREVNIEAVRDWYQKIVVLLDHHQITLVRRNTEIWAMMNTRGHGGRVSAAIMTKTASKSPPEELSAL